MTVLPARARHRLVEIVRGEHPEDHGGAGGERDLPDSGRALARDVVEVRRVPPDDRAEADHRVERRRASRCATSGISNAPGTQYTGTSSRPRSRERVERAFEQRLGDVVVEATGDDRDAHPAGVQRALVLRVLTHVDSSS